MKPIFPPKNYFHVEILTLSGIDFEKNPDSMTFLYLTLWTHNDVYICFYGEECTLMENF
jgi:hypothetical protein